MKIEGRDIDCVVLGASTGGVEAINTILKVMTKPLAVPLVVTLHTPPHSDLILDAFQGGHPEIRIKEVEDKELMVGGTIYFAPPDYHVLFERDRSLSLSSEEQVCFSRPSIDVMFESAAECFADRVLGILLTGANEDGAVGLKAIHDAGGLTWVQCPRESKSEVMPKAALSLFDPVQILSLVDMGRLIYG